MQEQKKLGIKCNYNKKTERGKSIYRSTKELNMKYGTNAVDIYDKML